MQIQCLASFETQLSLLKNCPDRATQLPTSASFQPHFLKQKNNKNIFFFHSKMKFGVGQCCDTLTPEVAMTGTRSNFFFAQTPPPSGVLTGAIHHSGMGPPTIQGWAINRPELSRSSPRLAARLLFAGRVFNWKSDDLVFRVIWPGNRTITTLERTLPPPRCKKQKKIQRISAVSSVFSKT